MVVPIRLVAVLRVTVLLMEYDHSQEDEEESIITTASLLIISTGWITRRIHDCMVEYRSL